MNFYVYMIITKKINRYITYVGYSKDPNKRILLHNNSKGAKFTKGSNWKLIYKKK
jgi:Predicted endonuclease containing a URI domain